MKKIIYRVLFLIILLGIFKKSNGQDKFQLAVKEYFNGDLNKAVDLLTQAIGDGVETAKSYMYRGAAYGFLKNYVKSVSDLDSSALLDSNNSRLEYYYGKTYLLQGLYDLSLEHFKNGLNKNPKDADYYDGIATINILKGNFPEAIIMENQALILNSSNSIYYINRGFAKAKLNSFQEAIEDYTISLKLNQSHKGYANRGYAYSQIGRHENAINDFSKALEIYPEDSEIIYLRGISYKAMGKKAEACNDFEKSLKLGHTSSVKEIKESCSF